MNATAPTSVLPPVRSPQLWKVALETRAFGERFAFDLLAPALERLPHGDGHTVLVLPGFTADDRSTLPLRQLLSALDYRPFGWDLGFNYGPTPRIVNGLLDLFTDLAERSDGPISVVGWSLGGIYARAIAREAPDLVRQVITLGSPIGMLAGDHSTSSRMWDSLAPSFDPDALPDVADEHRPPLQMPSSAVYSRTDGIVHWRTCLAQEGRQSENIEVYGSHCGLGFNPAVAVVLADRLVQPVGRWQQFDPSPLLRTVFPKPARWRPRSHS